MVEACGRDDPSPRVRRERMRRDLSALVDAGVVHLGHPDPAVRAGGVDFLDDSGGGLAYDFPSADDAMSFRLPSSFFTNGWHLVLTPQEIVMLLVIQDAYRQSSRADWVTDGVPLTQHTRWKLVWSER